MASVSPPLPDLASLPDPTGLRSDLANGGVKKKTAVRAAPLLAGGPGGGFTRGGRRSTVASNLRVKPGKQPAAFSERQERLYAQIRYQAEAKIDEALAGQRSSIGMQVPTAHERRKADRAKAGIPEPAPPTHKPKSRGGGKRGGAKTAREPKTMPTGYPEPPKFGGGSARAARDAPERRAERAQLHSRGRRRFNVAAARNSDGADDLPGRKVQGTLSAAEMAADPVRMRKHLETLASNMRRQHVKATNDQKNWEERRTGQQQRITGLMEEARRQVGRGLMEEMVGNERAKIKQARQAPRKMKKHVNAWAGFEAEVEAGFIKEIRLTDIPFPPKDNVLLLPQRGENSTSAERKQAYRTTSLRWHPGEYKHNLSTTRFPREVSD